MRRFILLLCAIPLLAAHGQTAADSLNLPQPTTAVNLRYWFDDDASSLQTAPVSETYAIEVSSMYSGLHTLHCQLVDSEGSVTATVSSIFMKVDSTEATFLSALRYWFDDEETIHSASIYDGVQTIDVSSLIDGFHFIHYTIACADGSVTPVQTRYFMQTTSRQPGEMKLYYLINDDTEVKILDGTASDGFHHYEMDISALSLDNHTMNYWLVADDGFVTPAQTAIIGAFMGDSIVLTSNTILPEDYRFSHMPSVSVQNSVTFTINGTTGMEQRHMNLDADLTTDTYSQVLSASDSIFINGDMSERIYTQGMTWNFLSLPFDCDLSRLATENGTAYAIRYYDGASRAANNVAVGNWKNYGRNDIIPMGTGFIYMTEHDTWTQFYAVDNENKNQVFRSTSSSTALEMQQNEAREAAHSGWNLLGNPYANYYSIHATDFDKAVTYWNGETGTYDVCYPGDDDLALKPNQAFFVQCPSGRESITMPGSGRQLTGEIGSGAKARRAQLNAGKDRKLINLSLSDSKFTDKTRVVLNEEAKMEYELECDASKFMSMRNEVPQLYSIGPKSIHYAVNERPLDDGMVKLGVYIPADGDYTLTITRNDAEQVLLTDSETGQTTDLTDGSYSFYAKKGTYNNRLTLTFGTATGIQSSPTPKGGVPCGKEYYDLSGRRIGQPAKAGVYLLKQGKMVKKVMVK